MLNLMIIGCNLNKCKEDYGRNRNIYTYYYIYYLPTI